jgi:hypothetical protein
MGLGREQASFRTPTEERAGSDVAAGRSGVTLSDAQLHALATMRIYFGHQSVGANIVDGMRALSAGTALRIVSAQDPASVNGPAFIEATIGKNGDPRSKAAAFRAALDRGFGHKGGIAMYKYCYVDTDVATDPGQMFAAYRDDIATVRAQYPRLTLVHVTQPLTTSAPTTEGIVTRLARIVLGRPSSDELNAKRQQYNALLRAEYQGKEPLFDLARLESTRADGSRNSTRPGSTTESLAPEWTDDGGHLNAVAQKMVARELIALLAGL